MFSVYGVTGQSFRGSLEKLIAIPGLSAARRSRGINQEGDELGPEMRVSGRENQEDGQYQKAAQAYRQMLGNPQGESMRFRLQGTLGRPRLMPQ